MMRKLSHLIVGSVVVCALGPAITAPATPAQEAVTANIATPTGNIATPIAEVLDEETQDRLSSATDDVPMYRGNPARTGEMPGPDLQGQIGKLWRVETSQEV